MIYICSNPLIIIVDQIIKLVFQSLSLIRLISLDFKKFQPHLISYQLWKEQYEWDFKMRKVQNHKNTKNQQTQQSTSSQRPPSRKGSIFDKQTLHLNDLKDKGKKVLKKLIPNQSLGMLKKLVQKGAGTIKRQIMHNQQLLPSLTLKNMQAQIFEKMIPQNSHFQEMNMKLTHSMLFFQQNISGEAQQGELLRLQTSKCYKKIPSYFFENELSSDTMAKILTRNTREAHNLRDDFADYYDEVDFNVNQQVNYKMKVFMSFVTFLTSIGQLADLSIKKIKGTRIKNNMIRQIVVQRSERVSSRLLRKQEIEQTLEVMFALKKMKKMQDLLMSQVQAKGKISIAETFEEYCRLHETLKQYCCPRLICKYWDVSYYVGRGYHDTFTKSLKNYIGEIIFIKQMSFKSILQPNKQQYQTSNIDKIDIVSINLDESYEVDEGDIELVTKHNIERQIVHFFKQGLSKCTYSTDQVCQQLKMQIRDCQNQLYTIIDGKQKILSENLTEKERKMILDKLPISKYTKIVGQWSDRMKKIIRRQISVVEKALKVLKQIRDQYPQKEQVISSYLMQIIYITFIQIDQSISFIIKGRKIKTHETDPIRQLLQCSQQWKDLIMDIKNYKEIWSKLSEHFPSSNQKNQQNCIIDGLIGKFLSSRRKIVQLMINVYDKTAIEQLPLKIQDDEWKTIHIMSKYYNTIGQIIYGPSFSNHMERLQRKLLSSSLLLQRNTSLMNTCDKQKHNENIESNQTLAQFDLQVGENTVTLDNETFKVLSSTLSVIDCLHGYLQWVNESGQGQLLENTVLGKVMAFIIMYNQNIKRFILDKQLVNYGKIKSKSITAKHYVITYSQLKFFKLLSRSIQNRFQSFKNHSDIIQNLIQKNMNEISKRFRDFLMLAIKESITKIVVDCRKPISWPLQQSTQIVKAVNRSSEYVKDILLSSKQMGQFLGIQWCSSYLQQINSQYKSVYKFIMNSNGTRKSKDIDWTDNLYWKFRELEYVVQNLQQYRQYLPGFDNIMRELQKQRKKLQNPN